MTQSVKINEFGDTVHECDYVGESTVYYISFSNIDRMWSICTLDTIMGYVIYDIENIFFCPFCGVKLE